MGGAERRQNAASRIAQMGLRDSFAGMNSPAPRRPFALRWLALVILAAAVPGAAVAYDPELERLLAKYKLGAGGERSVYIDANAVLWATRLGAGTEEGVSAETLRTLASVGTGVVDGEQGDTECPINVEVANVGEAALWEAGVTITQTTSSGVASTAALTIPYIPAGSAARVEVACSGYSGGITLDLTPLAIGQALSGDVARQIATMGTDFSLSSSTYRPASANVAGLPGGPTSRLAAVWPYIRLGDQAPLARALTESEQGLAGLVRVLRPEDHEWFVAALPTFSVASRGSVAAALIARPDMEFTGVAAFATLCPGKQAAALWAKAAAGEFPAGNEMVLQKCLPTGPAFAKAFASLSAEAQARLVLSLDDAQIVEHLSEFAADPALREPLRTRMGSVADPEAFTALSAVLRPLDEDGYLDALLRGAGPGQPLRNDVLVAALAEASPPSDPSRPARLYGIALESGLPSEAVYRALVAAVPADDPNARAAALSWLTANTTPFDATALLADANAPQVHAALFARYSLAGCDADAETAIACAEEMVAELPALASGPLSAEFLGWYQRALEEVLSESPATFEKKPCLLEAAFAPWKPVVTPVGDALLAEATVAERRGDSASQAHLLAVASRIDPGNSAVARRKWMSMFDMPILAASVLLRLNLVGAPLLLGLALTTDKLRKRRREAPLPTVGAGEAAASSPTSAAQLAAALTSAMAAAAAALRNEGQAGTAAASSLDLAIGGSGPLTGTIHKALLPALADGAVRSALVDLPRVRICAVIVPDRDDQPHHAQRHRLLRGPWATTLGQLRTAAPSRELPLLCLICFFEPDGSGGALLVAFDDGTNRVIPARLLTEAARAAESGTMHARSYELRLP